VLALCETAGHLDHICDVLKLEPQQFEANKMWKHAPSNSMGVMRERDLNSFLLTQMDLARPDAWKATLMRPRGTSPFTGANNWADGSNSVSES
jgi:hypothetical protein